MTVCKHCGTEIEDGLEYCPNCGQSIDDNLSDFFSADEMLEEEAYNIFDAPEDFDMDELLSREFDMGVSQKQSESVSIQTAETEELEEPVFFSEPEFSEEDLFHESEEVSGMDVFPGAEELSGMDLFPDAEELSGMDFFPDTEEEEENTVQNITEGQDDLAELLGLFSDGTSGETEPQKTENVDGFEFPVAEETDFLALDDLFQDLEAEPEELNLNEPEPVEQGLEELLAVGTEESEETEGKKKKSKKAKKEKKSFFKTVFGNVPIDPSKVKPEPTPEQIAAKKQKEEEEKKAKAEEKKLAAEEKKQIAQRNKEEKARQKALAKEEKKAKKMEEAKQILEEMKETRINRLGATIVFLFFAICAVALLSGSEIFGYAISIHSAEENFNKAYNNNVKYYTDAYNDIYGLEIKPEDQILSDKIMTVMFVNKELNSYNSYMVMEDYEAALHSLLLGLYRYGKYYEKAIPLGIDRDMDFVRTQILKELKATFGVSEDEAEVLRSMLEDAGAGGMNSGINADAARGYNLKLYEIIEESGLKQ